MSKEVEPAALERWTSRRLAALIPGAGRWCWLNTWIPDLEGRGVLVRSGQAWLGRRDQIVAALMDQSASVAT